MLTLFSRRGLVRVTATEKHIHTGTTLTGDILWCYRCSLYKIERCYLWLFSATPIYPPPCWRYGPVAVIADETNINVSLCNVHHLQWLLFRTCEPDLNTTVNCWPVAEYVIYRLALQSTTIQRSTSLFIISRFSFSASCISTSSTVGLEDLPSYLDYKFYPCINDRTTLLWMGQLTMRFYVRPPPTSASVVNIGTRLEESLSSTFHMHHIGFASSRSFYGENIHLSDESCKARAMIVP